MKLLIDRVEDVQYTIEEGRDGQKPSMYIEGIYMQSELKNKNGRYYPKAVLEEAATKYITEKVKNGVAYGELSHPSGPNINPDRVCHRVVSLDWDKNNIIGKSKIGGPMGESVIKLMELGGKIGVSSRGLGSLKASNGLMEVQQGFRIASAADVVLDPSAPDAYVKGIMEDKEWVYDIIKGIWTEQRISNFVEEVSEKPRKMSKRKLEEAKLRIFNKFITEISK